MEEKKISEMNIVEFQDALEDLKKSNRDQADYEKRIWILTMISTISIVIVALFIIIYCSFLIPKVNNLLNVAQTSLENIEKVSEELSDADIDGLIVEVGGLVGTTQEDLGLAMEKIDELNIEELNRAIKNLSDVIEPLAQFFGVLGGKAEDLSKLDVGAQVEDRISNIGSGIEGTVYDIGSNVEGTVEEIGDTIEDSVSDFGKNVGDSIKKGIGDGIEKGIENTLGKPAAKATKKIINKNKNK